MGYRSTFNCVISTMNLQVGTDREAAPALRRLSACDRLLSVVFASLAQDLWNRPAPSYTPSSTYCLRAPPLQKQKHILPYKGNIGCGLVSLISWVVLKQVVVILRPSDVLHILRENRQRRSFDC